MRGRWNLAFIGGVVVMIGAALLLYPLMSKPKVLVALPIPLSYPGFEVWPTPRTFDNPGTAIIRSGDRIIYAGKIDVEPEKAGEEQLFEATTSDTWTGSELAQYLGTTPAKLKVNSDQKITVKVQLSGAERWRIDPHKAEEELDTFRWIKEEGKRFIVVEAIAVRGIDYDVTMDGTRGGEVEVPDITDAKGSVSVQKTSANGWSAHQSFVEPHYVFYAARRALAPGEEMNPSMDYPLLIPEKILAWTHEEQPRSSIWE